MRRTTVPPPASIRVCCVRVRAAGQAIADVLDRPHVLDWSDTVRFAARERVEVDIRVLEDPVELRAW